MKAFALQYDGRLVPGTLGETRDACWSAAWAKVAEVFGEQWRKTYWKKWEASIRSAARRGYRIVPVEVVPSAAFTVARKNSVGCCRAWLVDLKKAARP